MSHFIKIGRDEKSKIAEHLLTMLSSHYGVPTPIWKFDPNAPYYLDGVIGLTQERDYKASYIKEEILHEYYHYLTDKLSNGRLQELYFKDIPILNSIEAGARRFSEDWFRTIGEKSR